MARPSPTNLNDEIRLAAESDLLKFIKLVAPYRVLGACHEELVQWWERSERKSHQLVLLPRDHQKSALIAYRCAWRITKDPSIRIMYLSSTANLAEKQLKMVKDILTSDKYKKYWPDMVHPEEGKREKWAVSEFSVDHPLRKEEGIRDPTMMAVGLTSSFTGMHCDIAVLDDVVVIENAYTEDGREKVRQGYSLLSSVESADAEEWAVGTHYHFKDLYMDLKQIAHEIYDATGEVVDKEPVYEVFERKVEDKGDGTGEFLWPRQRRSDGKWYGFNAEILSKKRAQYLDTAQYRAQYYNDPTDPDNVRIDRTRFQYYDKKHLTQADGYWWMSGRKLALTAAIDFAFSLKKKSDFTAIVVVGMDEEGNIYVLDIDRFKADNISAYFDHVKDMYGKWGFRKMRAEVTVAQSTIVEELKNQYIKAAGIPLAIDPFRPSKNEGTKEERISAILENRYNNQVIWHYKGGYCQTLEEELVLTKPPHDDLKDALASAIEIAVLPRITHSLAKKNHLEYHSRFGGVTG